VPVPPGAPQATPGLEQYAYKKYAEAFEAIPMILAENAGFDVRSAQTRKESCRVHHPCGANDPRALGRRGRFRLQGTDVVSKLYAAHNAGKATVGVDVEDEENKISDAAAKGVLDSLLAKHWAIRYATEAAITVLRVDQIIMSKPSGGPKPKANPNWDEDPDPAQQ